MKYRMSSYVSISIPFAFFLTYLKSSACPAMSVLCYSVSTSLIYKNMNEILFVNNWYYLSQCSGMTYCSYLIWRAIIIQKEYTDSLVLLYASIIWLVFISLLLSAYFSFDLRLSKNNWQMALQSFLFIRITFCEWKFFCCC